MSALARQENEEVGGYLVKEVIQQIEGYKTKLKSNQNVGDRKKTLDECLRYFSSENQTGKKRLQCVDLISEYSQSDKVNRWQDLVEHVMFAARHDLKYLVKKKGKMQPSFNALAKIIGRCEGRKPGLYLERSAKEIFSHILFAMKTSLDSVTSQADAPAYLEVANKYEKILNIMLKSPVYCKALNWDKLKEFILMCFGKRTGEYCDSAKRRRVLKLSSRVLKNVLKAFCYDFEIKEIYRPDTGEEFVDDFCGIFESVSVYFQDARGHDRAAADEERDIGLSMLSILNVVIENGRVNTLDALCSYAKSPFLYACEHLVDNSSLHRLQALTFVRSVLRLTHRSTKWYIFQNMDFSVEHHFRNIYKSLVGEKFRVPLYQAQAGLHVKDFSGAVGHKNKPEIELQVNLIADIIYYGDIINAQTKSSENGKTPKYESLSGTKRKRENGATETKQNSHRQLLSIREHLLEGVYDRNHIAIYSLYRVMTLYPDLFLFQNVTDKSLRCGFSLKWFEDIMKALFDRLSSRSDVGRAGSARTVHTGEVYILACIQRSLYLLKYIESHVDNLLSPNEWGSFKEMKNMWVENFDSLLNIIRQDSHNIEHMGPVHQLACLIISNGMRYGSCGSEGDGLPIFGSGNMQTLWHLAFNRPYYHNMYVLKMVFSAIMNISLPSATTKTQIFDFVITFAASCKLFSSRELGVTDQYSGTSNLCTKAHLTYAISIVLCILLNKQAESGKIAGVGAVHDLANVHIDGCSLEAHSIERNPVMPRSIGMETKRQIDACVYEIAQCWWKHWNSCSSSGKPQVSKPERNRTAPSVVKQDRIDVGMSNKLFRWITSIKSNRFSNRVDDLSQPKHFGDHLRLTYITTAWVQTIMSLSAYSMIQLDKDYIKPVHAIVHDFIVSIGKRISSWTQSSLSLHRTDNTARVESQMIDALMCRFEFITRLQSGNEVHAANRSLLGKLIRKSRDCLLGDVAKTINVACMEYISYQDNPTSRFNMLNASSLHRRSPNEESMGIIDDDDEFEVEMAEHSSNTPNNGHSVHSNDSGNRIRFGEQCSLVELYKCPFINNTRRRIYGAEDVLYLDNFPIEWFLYTYGRMIIGSSISMDQKVSVAACVHKFAETWKHTSNIFSLASNKLLFFSSPSNFEIIQSVLRDAADNFIADDKKVRASKRPYTSISNTRLFFSLCSKIVKHILPSQGAAVTGLTGGNLAAMAGWKDLMKPIVAKVTKVLESAKDLSETRRDLPRDVRHTIQLFCGDLLTIGADEGNDALFEVIFELIESWIGADLDFEVLCLCGNSYSKALTGRDEEEQLEIYTRFVEISEDVTPQPSLTLPMRSTVLGQVAMALTSPALVPHALLAIVEMCIMFPNSHAAGGLAKFCVNALAKNCGYSDPESYKLVDGNIEFLLKGWINIFHPTCITDFPFKVFYPTVLTPTLASFLARHQKLLVSEIVLQGSGARVTKAEEGSGLEKGESTEAARDSVLNCLTQELNRNQDPPPHDVASLVTDALGIIFARNCELSSAQSSLVNTFLITSLGEDVFCKSVCRLREEIVLWILLSRSMTDSVLANISDGVYPNAFLGLQNILQNFGVPLSGCSDDEIFCSLPGVSVLNLVSYLKGYITSSSDIAQCMIGVNALYTLVKCIFGKHTHISHNGFSLSGNCLLLEFVHSILWHACDKSQDCWPLSIEILVAYTDTAIRAKKRDVLQSGLKKIIRVLLLPFVCADTSTENSAMVSSRVLSVAQQALEGLHRKLKASRKLSSAFRQSLPEFAIYTEKLQFYKEIKGRQVHSLHLGHCIANFLDVIRGAFHGENTRLTWHYAQFALKSIYNALLVWNNRGLGQPHGSTMTIAATMTEGLHSELTSDRDNVQYPPILSKFIKIISEQAHRVISMTLPIARKALQTACQCLGSIRMLNRHLNYESSASLSLNFLGQGQTIETIGVINLLKSQFKEYCKSHECIGSSFLTCYSTLMTMSIRQYEQNSGGNLSSNRSRKILKRKASVVGGKHTLPYPLHVVKADALTQGLPSQRGTPMTEAVLWDPAHSSYVMWVTKLTTMLINNSGMGENTLLSECKHVCSIDPLLAEAMFPLAIYMTLKASNASVRDQIGQRLRSILLQHCDNKQAVSVSSKQSKYHLELMKKTTALAINTFEFLRKQHLLLHVDTQNTTLSRLGNQRSLSSMSNQHRVDFMPSLGFFSNESNSISFLEIANAAIFCDMNILALLYSELHYKYESRTERYKMQKLSIDALHSITEYENTIYAVNKRLQDEDAMSASLFFSLDGARDSQGVINEYEPQARNSAYKLTLWEPILDATERKDYPLLKRLLEKERQLIVRGTECVQPLDRAFMIGQMQSCHVLELACMPTCLKDNSVNVENASRVWGKTLFELAEDKRIFPFVNFFLRKREQTLLAWNDRKMHLRHVISTSVAARHSENLYVAIDIISRLRKILQMPDYAVELASENLETYVKVRIAIEEGLVFSAQGKMLHSIAFCKRILQVLKNITALKRPNAGRDESSWGLHDGLESNVLRFLGTWTSELRSENASSVINKYFSPALKHLPDHADAVSAPDTLEANYAAGKYMDSLYSQLVERKNSPEFKEMAVNRKRNREEYSKLKKREKMMKALRTKEASDLRKHIVALKKNLEHDENEIKLMQENTDLYLIGAARHYISCLVVDPDRKFYLKRKMFVVVRLIHLLFQNPTVALLQNLMRENVERLDIASFLPFVQQLTSRIDSGTGKDVEGGGDRLSTTLEALLVRMVVHDPHKCLPSLILLQNAKLKDDQMTAKDDVRRNIANSILAQYKDSSANGGARIASYENVMEAYRRLALWMPQETKTSSGHKKFSPPLGKQIHVSKYVTDWTKLIRAADLKQGLVALWGNTSNLTDSPTVLLRLSDQFQVSKSGISRPKILYVHGTDGKSHGQIVKGGDDLNKDELIQQVFALVNSLLYQDLQCRRRGLAIRKYKIVPLAGKTGVIEMVQNSEALRDYLSVAHKQWNPNDWSQNDCWQALNTAYKSSRKDKDQHQSTRIEAYKKVCNNFRPAMYNEMIYRSSNMQKWYNSRMAYIRSVALTSIVGYILGLGDRHASNILIDKGSHELVHIDFGIAFEDGKILTTPEKVPFRLTRDLVDGMGISGYEGVFQRCCEETLRLLKNNQDALLFILDAFVHNPLSEWKIDPIKWMKKLEDNAENNTQLLDGSGAGSEQVTPVLTRNLSRGIAFSSPGSPGTDSPDASTTKNKHAERAIGRIKQKLNGYHDGNLMGIEGHVKNLIMEATDVENLALIFPGWGPYF